MAISKFNYNSFNVTPVAGAALAFDADADGFSTATSTALTHIKTLTASSSATLSFVDGSSDVVFDNTYPVYLFKFFNIHPASTQPFLFQGSTDTGSSYGVTMTSSAFRVFNNEAGTSTSLSADTGNDQAQATGFQKLHGNIVNSNDHGGSGELYIFSPSSTTFVKHFLSRINASLDDAVVQEQFIAGYFNTTSAIDAIQFKMNSGNIDSGTIKLYGIKDS
tara:strand:- start:435 stop:1094 length:660 start_codon:yes stop_codon:yes gene_type:complete